MTFNLEVGPSQFERVSMLIDTGASHILLVFPADKASQEFTDAYAKWPEEMLFGVGSVRVRRAPSGVLRPPDDNSDSFEIAVTPVHILLYEADDSGFAARAIPPSLIGFQHPAFGMSQLLIDNASQRLVLTYQEAFTPTRLE